MTVVEKLKTMEPVEVAHFYQKVFKRETIMDDLYCKHCKERHNGCPCNGDDCLVRSVDLVKWFLERPFAEVEQMMERE